MPRLPVLLVAIITAVAVTGCGRTETVYNVNAAPVVGTKRQLTADHVRSAIIKALRTNNWTVRQEYPDKIIADTAFRSHSATIEIDYSSTNYSISYRNSENLRYDGSEIHRNYNKLIKTLEEAINQNLAYV